jgi:hypothetical protein
MEGVMKIGDIYVETKYGGLVIIGVVSNEPDQDGYFQSWEITVSKHSGNLLNINNATHKLPDQHIVPILDVKAKPSNEPSAVEAGE